MTNKRVEAIAKILYKNIIVYNMGLYPNIPWERLPEEPGSPWASIKSNCRFHAENVLAAIEELDSIDSGLF